MTIYLQGQMKCLEMFDFPSQTTPETWPAMYHQDGRVCRRVDINVFYAMRDHQRELEVHIGSIVLTDGDVYGPVEDPVDGWTCNSIYIEPAQIECGDSKDILQMRQQ